MKFIVYNVSPPGWPENWGWRFVDHNGIGWLTQMGAPDATKAEEGLIDFLTILGVDPETVEIEVLETQPPVEEEEPEELPIEPPAAPAAEEPPAEAPAE